EDLYDNEPDVVRWWDGYSILLYAGESVTVTATGHFPYRFTYWAGGSYVDGHFNVPAGQSRSFTVTAGARAFYGFYIISENHQGTGSHSITFSSVSGGSSLRAGGEAVRFRDMVELMQR
ncbi:MAG TPA: hypothetical protein VMK65_10570, partial [Longimicrobiales bacterium]|nr:hypothetical protein [Longimicrobiales bacterium]